MYLRTSCEVEGGRVGAGEVGRRGAGGWGRREGRVWRRVRCSTEVATVGRRRPSLRRRGSMEKVERVEAQGRRVGRRGEREWGSRSRGTVNRIIDFSCT